MDAGRRGHDPRRPACGGGRMSIETITFGCRLNAYESEVMKTEAEKSGLSDAIIINTCAVTAEAVRQAKQSIRKARRESPHAGAGRAATTSRLPALKATRSIRPAPSSAGSTPSARSCSAVRQLRNPPHSWSRASASRSSRTGRTPFAASTIAAAQPAGPAPRISGAVRRIAGTGSGDASLPRQRLPRRAAHATRPPGSCARSRYARRHGR